MITITTTKISVLFYSFILFYIVYIVLYSSLVLPVAQYCYMLFHIVPWYCLLPYIALYCFVLFHIVVKWCLLLYIVLQIMFQVASHCSIVLPVALCCSILLHVVSYCSIVLPMALYCFIINYYCYMLFLLFCSTVLISEPQFWRRTQTQMDRTNCSSELHLRTEHLETKEPFTTTSVTKL